MGGPGSGRKPTGRHPKKMNSITKKWVGASHQTVKAGKRAKLHKTTGRIGGTNIGLRKTLVPSMNKKIAWRV